MNSLVVVNAHLRAVVRYLIPNRLVMKLPLPAFVCALILFSYAAVSEAQHLENRWTHTLETRQTGEDRGMSVARDAEGNSYMTAFFQGEVTIDTFRLSDPEAFGAFVAKYSPQGKLLWVTPLPYTQSPTVSALYTRISVDDSGVYIAGNRKDSVPDGTPEKDRERKCFLARYDTRTGTRHWMQELAIENADLAGISVLGDEIFVAGNFTGTAATGLSGQSVTSRKSDIFLLKCDKGSGKVMTMRQIGGEAYDDTQAMAVNATGVYLTGYFQGVCNFDQQATDLQKTAAGKRSVFLARYDPKTLAVRWVRQIDSSEEFWFNGTSVCANETDIYVAGIFADTCRFHTDEASKVIRADSRSTSSFIARYDLAEGRLVWVKQISGTEIRITVNKLAVSKAGLFAAGNFVAPKEALDFNTGGPPVRRSAKTFDGFVALYTLATAENVWVKPIGGSDEYAYDNVQDITVTDSLLYVTGDFHSKNCDFNIGDTAVIRSALGLADSYVACYRTATGRNVWVRQTGNLSGGDQEFVSAVRTDAQKNVYVVGNFTGHLPLGGQHYISRKSDGFIVKYDSIGRLQWIRTLGGDGDDGVSDIAFTEAAVYLVGSFQGVCVFDSKAGIRKTAVGDKDMFLAKYDISFGRLVWVKQIGGKGNSVYVHTMLTDKKGVYLVGNSRGTADFDIGKSPKVKKCQGVVSFYVAKYDLATGDNLWVKQTQGSIHTSQQAVLDKTGIYVVSDASNACQLAEEQNVYQISRGQTDGFLTKYDIATGNVRWIRQIGGTDYDGIENIVIDATGVYISGTYRGKCDFNIGGRPVIRNTSSRNGSIFIAKYAPASGENLWVTEITNLSGKYTNGRGMTLNRSGVYVARVLYGDYSIDSTVTGTPILLSGYSNIAVASFDQRTGKCRWAEQIGHPTGSEQVFLLCATGGDLYMAGLFSGFCNFSSDPGKPVYRFTSSGNDMFVCKFMLR